MPHVGERVELTEDDGAIAAKSCGTVKADLGNDQFLVNMTHTPACTLFPAPFIAGPFSRDKLRPCHCGDASLQSFREGTEQSATYLCYGVDRQDLTERVEEAKKTIDRTALKKPGRWRVKVKCDTGHENIFVGED